MALAQAEQRSSADIQLKAPLRGHTKSIIEVAFSPDGEIVATGSEDGTVRLWSARTGEMKDILRGADKYKWVTIAWSLDGQTIAIKGTRKDGDGKIQVWDAHTGKVKATLLAATSEDYGLTWSPDGRKLLTTTSKRFAKLWDAETGSLLATLEQDPPCPKQSFWKSLGSNTLCSDVSFVYGHFDAEGQNVLTTSMYHSAKLWDATTGKLKATLPLTKEVEGESIYPYTALLSPDRRLVVRYNQDGVALLEMKSGEVRRALGEIGEPLAFSPDGHMLLTVKREPEIKLRGGEDELRLYDIMTGQLRLTFEKIPHGVGRYRLYWSPDGKAIVVIGSGSTKTRLLDTRTGRVKARLPYGGCTSDVWWGSGGCESFIFNADGRITLKIKNPLNLWSTDTGELLATMDAAARPPAFFSPTDARLLITSGQDKKTVLLWEVVVK